MNIFKLFKFNVNLGLCAKSTQTLLSVLNKCCVILSWHEVKIPAPFIIENYKQFDRQRNSFRLDLTTNEVDVTWY